MVNLHRFVVFFVIILLLSINISCSNKEKTAEDWFNQGNDYYYDTKYADAIRCYNKAIALNPDDPSIWYKKGFALYYQDKYGEALQCYDRALDLDPKNINVLIAKGTLFYTQKRYKEAIKCYDKVLEIDPANAAGKEMKSKALEALSGKK
jgi:tetratricopeptide (TPR) repeat protein